MAHQRLSNRQKQVLNTWLDWSCDRSNKTQVTGVIGKARKQKTLARPLDDAKVQSAKNIIKP